jgi:tetratricopeptide (TPR) repeat protein
VTEEEVVTEPKAIEELPIGNEKILFVVDEELMVNMAKQKPQAYDHLNAGYNFYKQGDYNNALAEYNKAIEDDTNNNEAYYYRGVIFSKIGENDKALPDFKQSIELYPYHFESYLYLDWVLAKQRKWDTIISYWNEFIQLEPEHAQAYLERGGAYYHQGNLDAALKDAKKSCDLGSSEGCIEYKQLREQW